MKRYFSQNPNLVALPLGCVLGMLLAAPSTGVAQTTSTFTPAPVDDPSFVPTGRWDDPDDWDTPNFPDNGQPNPGDTYNAVVRAGTVFLFDDHEIEVLTLGASPGIQIPGDPRETGAIENGTFSSTRYTLTVNDLFTWETGDVQGAVTINAMSGIALTTEAGKILRSSTDFQTGERSLPTVNHDGVGVWTAGTVGGSEEIPFNNLSTATLTATAAGGRFSTQFNNEGALIIDPGAGNVIDFLLLNNNGTVEVRSGTLQSDRGFTQRVSGGDFVIEEGALLVMRDFDLTPTSSVTGAGSVEIGQAFSNLIRGTYDIGGTTTLQDNLTLERDIRTGDLVVDTSIFSDANLNGGAIHASGPTVWRGSLGGNGTVNADGGLDFVHDEFLDIEDDLVVQLGPGSTWSGSGSIDLIDNAQISIKPEGDWTITGRRFLNGGGTVTNSGTLTKTGGGTLEVDPFVDNSGLITIGTDSQITFSRSVTQDIGELRLDGGATDFIVNRERTVRLQGGMLTGFGTIRNIVTSSLVTPGLVGGDETGTFEILETFEFAEGASLAIDLGGTGTGGFDRLFRDQYSSPDPATSPSTAT